MSLRGFSSENRGRTFSKDQSQRHDTSAPAFATLVRPSHAQAPAVLDHSRTLPQGDGGTGPAFAGGAVGSERDLIVLDASDVLHDAFAVRGPRIDAEGEVSSECAHVAPKICLVHWGASYLLARTARPWGALRFSLGPLLFWGHLPQSSSASRFTAGAANRCSR